MIPLSAPHIVGNEWKYIKDCLDSGWVSSAGEYVTRFEKEFAAYVGAKYAVATCNGTSALHLALYVSGLRPGQEILAPTITFVATINAVHYCRAVPVFFDCDEYFNIDLDSVEKFLVSQCTTRDGKLINSISNREIWGVVPTHVFGNPVDMHRLRTLANRFSLQIVEDAAEALGSSIDGRHLGTFGTTGCFSFNGNKIITSGGGGMVVSDSKELSEKVRYLSSQAKDDPIRFIHNEVGYNYRLTNVQAALGLAQLEMMPEYLERKRTIHNRYRKELGACSKWVLCDVPGTGVSNYWLNNLVINRDSGETAMGLIEKLGRAGIEARPVWFPNHLQKTNKESASFEIKNAESIVQRTVSIPSSVGLTDDQQSYVISELTKLDKSK